MRGRLRNGEMMKEKVSQLRKFDLRQPLDAAVQPSGRGRLDVRSNPPPAFVASAKLPNAGGWPTR